MDEIKVDPRDLKPAPCSECESVITQTIEEMGMDEQLEFPFDEPEPLDEDFDDYGGFGPDFDFETFDDNGDPY